MIFKDRLREKRTAAGMTQSELARRAGVTSRTIQNYELGDRRPSNMEVIQRIADALGTTTEYLLGSSGAYVVAAQMLYLAILLSANLGVMNLLPLPALDGGRLVFLFVEAVRKKRVPPEKEGYVHFAGIVLLMLLMVVVMYNDIQRVFF